MPLINRAGGGGGSSVPSIFGDGSDGDVVISSNTALPVTVPHQSIVEKNYKSLTINAGATLSCASWNAGMILRVKGDCTIHGTIDQSGKAPKTNPNNDYPYPAQLVCGDGGNGGSGKNGTGFSLNNSGVCMLKRTYGGGYGGGGGGSSGSGVGVSGRGGAGGSSTSITIDIPSIFIGGHAGPIGSDDSNFDNAGGPGAYGGGGGGGAISQSHTGSPGAGGNGAGANGGPGGTNSNYYAGGGGGAGNYGGGVILLYVGGNLNIDGSIRANGLTGGAGGDGVSSNNTGAGGGGGGGGAIYICYKEAYINTGFSQVNGGAGGTGINAGVAGHIGSITVLSYDDLEA